MMYLSPRACRKSGLGHFFEFLQGAGGVPPLPYCAPALAASRRSHTALPRWAGPMQKGKESMAVRPPDQRDDPFRYIGFSTV